MSREMLAVFVLVWLIGTIMGWCAGWAARTEQNRGWHAGVRRQLTAAHAQLAELRDELAAVLAERDDARAAVWQAQRTPAAPTVVQVHLNAPLPWPAHRSGTGHTTP